MGTGLELICQLAEPNGSSESESSLLDDKKKKKKNVHCFRSTLIIWFGFKLSGAEKSFSDLFL